jgi:hypothetical protein
MQDTTPNRVNRNVSGVRQEEAKHPKCRGVNLAAVRRATVQLSAVPELRELRYDLLHHGARSSVLAKALLQAGRPVTGRGGL